MAREKLTGNKKLGVKCVSTRTIGSDHIDLEAARELGILVCNANYAPDSVADFTIMMMLMCLRQYKQAFWRGYVNDFSLAGLEGRNLSAMTVGVMGTGRIGHRVIQDLQGFGCRILAYDVYQNAEVAKLAEYTDLDTLYKESDIITLHMPLLPSTHHIINQESIAKMKKGVILVNCARGGLTDTEALIEGIESMQIGALGMDTAEGEEVKAKAMIEQLFYFYKEHLDQLPAKYLRMMDEGESAERVVADYIAGMTDQYAITKFSEYFLPQAWQVDGY